MFRHIPETFAHFAAIHPFRCAEKWRLMEVPSPFFSLIHASESKIMPFSSKNAAHKATKSHCTPSPDGIVSRLRAQGRAIAGATLLCIRMPFFAPPASILILQGRAMQINMRLILKMPRMLPNAVCSAKSK
ncbi:MAG: hypothetical protein MR400_09080 [Clostridiales bacterium]|nr:hypothetical protein [Clostridiales bacterium]